MSLIILWQCTNWWTYRAVLVADTCFTANEGPVSWVHPWGYKYQ